MNNNHIYLVEHYMYDDNDKWLVTAKDEQDLTDQLCANEHLLLLNIIYHGNIAAPWDNEDIKVTIAVKEWLLHLFKNSSFADEIVVGDPLNLSLPLRRKLIFHSLHGIADSATMGVDKIFPLGGSRTQSVNREIADLTFTKDDTKEFKLEFICGFYPKPIDDDEMANLIYGFDQVTMADQAHTVESSAKVKAAFEGLTNALARQSEKMEKEREESQNATTKVSDNLKGLTNALTRESEQMQKQRKE